MDWNHIATLLSVIHSAASAGPKYAAIAKAAEAELWSAMTPPEVMEAVVVEDEDEDEDTATTPTNTRRL